MDIEQTYWAGNGKHRQLAERLRKKLVPEYGRAETMRGELLRCIYRIYHDRYNNGLGNADMLAHTKTLDFLLVFEDEIDNQLPTPMSVSQLVRDIKELANSDVGAANRWQHDELLERVLEACILIAAEDEEEDEDGDFSVEDRMVACVEPIPEDFPVQPVSPEEAKDPVTCGHCGLTWDDSISTGYTPAPAARCPFEGFHIHDDEN